MDFGFTPEQEALRDLARRILEDHVTVERLRATEASEEWFDRKTWAALAEAGLTGIVLPAEVGGGGLGIIELCLLLEQVGRTVAPVPIFPTLVLGALPVAQFGTPAQQERLLAPVARGESVLTAALAEAGSDDPAKPTTTARRDGAGWRLDGTKVCVSAAHLAERILVPARTDGGLGVFLLDPKAAGVALERQVTTNLEPQFWLTLSGAPVASGDVLGGPTAGAAVVEWLVERALVCLSAIQVGVAGRALEMTADYTNKREQFGKPIASFQAVHQRAADAYIDLEAIRLTMWQAAWRLSAGLPASVEAAVAKYWASEASARVTYAAQHLHGGIGVDVDYPLHRYYFWSKQIELNLGSGTPQLARLGAALAK
jgi:alkylation response protein AidB-like acyl-CoA dehydrogenase